MELPKREGVELRQSYLRLSKPAQDLDQRPSPACHQRHPARDAPARRHRTRHRATFRRITAGRNYLTGRDGDRINAVLAAAGYTSTCSCAGYVSFR